MKNIGQMMKKAQEMQARMGEMQEALEAFEAEGEVAGGLVKVRLNGKFEMLGVFIDPDAADPEDPAMLESMVQAAFNAARTIIDAKKKEMADEMTGGLPLPPGFKLPF